MAKKVMSKKDMIRARIKRVSARMKALDGERTVFKARLAKLG